MIRIIFIIEAGRSREHYFLLELEQVSLVRRTLGLQGLSRAEGFLLFLITVIWDIFGLVLWLADHTALLLEVEPLTFSDVFLGLSNPSLLGGDGGGGLGLEADAFLGQEEIVIDRFLGGVNHEKLPVLFSELGVLNLGRTLPLATLGGSHPRTALRDLQPDLLNAVQRYLLEILFHCQGTFLDVSEKFLSV